jgi:hypothetical protein
MRTLNRWQFQGGALFFFSFVFGLHGGPLRGWFRLHGCIPSRRGHHAASREVVVVRLPERVARASYLSIDSSRSSGGEVRATRPETQIGIRSGAARRNFPHEVRSRSAREQCARASTKLPRSSCSNGVLWGYALRAHQRPWGRTQVMAAASEVESQRGPRRWSFLAARSSAFAVAVFERAALRMPLALALACPTAS